jgi:Bifunctional DNA primase/polymerase, N-terminal
VNDTWSGPDPRLAWAAWWISLGMKVFVLATDKIPAATCQPCHEQHTTPELKAACDHLLCHSFYRASNDLVVIAEMLRQLPYGRLAVATGKISNVVVLDVEAGNKLAPLNPREWGGLPTGIEVLEQWESWVGGWSLPDTLAARSSGGGLHLFYVYPSGVKIPTGGFVLPNIEVKSDGSYVGVPCGFADRVLIDTRPAVEMPEPLVPMLTTRKRVGGSGGGNGYPGAAGGSIRGVPTSEFVERGLGWHTGSRNRDCYLLACRLSNKFADEADVLTVIRQAWEATAYTSDFPWHEAQKAVRSAGQHMAAARDQEAADVAAIMHSWSDLP